MADSARNPTSFADANGSTATDSFKDSKVSFPLPEIAGYMTTGCCGDAEIIQLTCV